MPNTEDEKKGIIYEAFVKLALVKVWGINPLWEPEWKDIIANQDFVYPSVEEPELVIAVTQWGSHEAANKKYWRTVEDIFEVYDKYPSVDFYSILFEKNHNSDDALDAQLRYLCYGKALSEKNSSCLVKLQEYVKTDEQIRAFGSGKDTVFANCENLYRINNEYRALIDVLGNELKKLKEETREKYNWCIAPMEAERKLSKERKSHINISSVRNTYYKMAIIKLLRFDDMEISLIIDAVKTNNWSRLKPELLNQLESLKLIRIVGFARRVDVDPVLESVAAVGVERYANIKKQISSLVLQEESSFAAYKDHYSDIIDEQLRKRRYDYLISGKTARELLSVEHLFDGNYTKRAWVLDYYLALKRKLTPHGKYGFQRLSEELGIKYTAGGIVSPLPRYASGIEDGITEDEKQRLHEYISQDIPTFNFELISNITIVDDRTVTLMKKLNVIEMLIDNSMERLKKLGYVVKPIYRIYSPIIAEGLNASAGATDYNFMISNGDKAVLVFVVSAYDASHKHKELSGRIRLGKVSREYPGQNTLNIIVYDGTLFGSAPEKKLKMLYEAGWDYIFYIDELEDMAKMIECYLK